MSLPRSFAAPIVLALSLGAASCVPDEGRPDQAATAFLRISQAELQRPTEGRALDIILRATEYEDPFLRQTAVRALGRLEDPARIPDIAPHLDDLTATVRVAAANAMAQAVHRSDGTPALAPLLGRVSEESDPNVRAVLAQSLGRLSLDADDRAEVVSTLIDMSFEGGSDAPMPTMVGIGLALEAASRARPRIPFGERAIGRLQNLVSFDLLESTDGLDGPRVRLLALMALVQSTGSATASVIEPAMRDPDPRVRAVAAGYLAAINSTARPELIRRGLGDPSVRVRVATVRQLGREEPTALYCDWLGQVATRDETQPVRVLAMDALARPCPDLDAQTRILLGAASALGPETREDWQVPAHALVSLAGLEPELAERLVPVYLEHPDPFVRSYGIRAAAVVGATEPIVARLEDSSANVRTEALRVLEESGLPGWRGILLDQLDQDDPQLLMTVSAMLTRAGVDAEAAEAALSAFERISAARRDTWRDSRTALLSVVGEGGAPALADRLRPFVMDYDSVVAQQAADLLGDWTGATVEAEPRPLPPLALPSASELRDLTRTLVTVHMRDGGVILIEPLPFLAPLNAHRFVRLAREGYFDGLTFHRWAPNFVIQGGSPGANEYSGDGPYSRDEVGLLPHWRGTVGLSTRGHDTGDGQIFINIIDNVRLNHDYTIYAIVQQGIDVVDRVLEGDVIERVEVTLRQ